MQRPLLQITIKCSSIIQKWTCSVIAYLLLMSPCKVVQVHDTGIAQKDNEVGLRHVQHLSFQTETPVFGRSVDSHSAKFGFQNVNRVDVREDVLEGKSQVWTNLKGFYLLVSKETNYSGQQFCRHRFIQAIAHIHTIIIKYRFKVLKQNNVNLSVETFFSQKTLSPKRQKSCKIFIFY